jgi:uncharacterized protein DUF4234
MVARLLLENGKEGPLSEPEEPITASSQPDGAEPDPAADRPSASTQPSLTPNAVAAAGWPGPIGKPRGVFFVILISIVTIGIYHLYWVYKVFDELKQHTGNGIGGVLGLVIALVINPVNWFVMPSEIGKMYRGDGRSAPMTGWTGLWIILPIAGWFVWTVKVQGALNRYWESKGQPT